MAEENLEDKVKDKESKGFMQKAFDLGFGTAAAVATTALSVSLLGGPAGIIIGGAFAGGGMIGSLIKGEKPLYEIVKEGVQTYAVLNTILYPMVFLGDMTFPLISNTDIYGKIARSVYSLTAYLGAFVVSFKTAHHLIDNKLNPSGLWHSISDNFWPTFRRFAWSFAPALSLVANGVTEIAIGAYKVPTFAVNALPVGFYNGINPPGVKKEKAREQYAPQAAYQPA